MSDAIYYPKRFEGLAFTLLVAAALLVANLRRGRPGRRLLAVRSNERAAAALGISPPVAKLYVALEVADRAVVLSRGVVRIEGRTSDLQQYLQRIQHAYLHSDPSQNGSAHSART